MNVGSYVSHGIRQMWGHSFIIKYVWSPYYVSDIMFQGLEIRKEESKSPYHPRGYIFMEDIRQYFYKYNMPNSDVNH